MNWFTRSSKASLVYRIASARSHSRYGITCSLHEGWTYLQQIPLGLLASTGLRVGEAIRLTVADVQLTATPPHLIIRETKFAKSRLVPLHATAAEHLRRYGVHRQRLGYDALSDTWLISEQGGPLLYSSLWIWFARFLRRLNIRSAEGKGPACIRFVTALPWNA